MFGVQPGSFNLRRFYALAERNHKQIRSILTPRKNGSMPTEFEAMAALFCTPLAKFSPENLDCLKDPETSNQLLHELETIMGTGEVSSVLLSLANRAVLYSTRSGDGSTLTDALFARAQLHFNLGQYEFCVEDCNEATTLVIDLEKESEMIDDLRQEAWKHISSLAMSRQKPVVIFDEGDHALKRGLRTLRHMQQKRKKPRPEADPFMEIFGPPEIDKWQIPCRDLQRIEQLHFHPSKVLAGLRNSLVGEVAEVDNEPKSGALIAAEDIKTSEVIMTQNPVCMALHPDVTSQYCYHCLKPILQLWTCDHCTAASFCSYGCKVASIPRHERVCDVMGNFLSAMKQSPNIMPSVMTAVNLLAAQGLEFWTNFWLRTFPSQLGWIGRPQPFTLSNLGRIGDAELEVSKKLEALFCGAENNFWKHPQKETPDLLIQCLFATLCLKKAEFFFAYSEQTVIFCAGLLLRFSSMIMSHGVNIFATDTLEDEPPVLVARAIYAPIPAMANSCDPNAIGYLISPSAMAWRALRPIKAGERITISRVAIFPTEHVTLRQEKFKQRGMKCTCKPCTRNWPTREDCSSNEPYHCPNCQSPIGEGTLVDLFELPTTCKECNADFSDTFKNLRRGLLAMRYLATDDPPALPQIDETEEPEIVIIERKMRQMTIGKGETAITCTVVEDDSEELSAGGDQSEEPKIRKVRRDVLLNRANYPDVNEFKFASTFSDKPDDPYRKLVKRPDLEQRIVALKRAMPDPVRAVAQYVDSLATFCDEKSYRMAEAKEFLGTLMATAGKVFQEPYDGSM